MNESLTSLPPSLPQSKLRGMNELSGPVSVSASQPPASAIVEKIYETANILQVQSQATDTLK